MIFTITCPSTLQLSQLAHTTEKMKHLRGPSTIAVVKSRIVSQLCSLQKRRGTEFRFGKLKSRLTDSKYGVMFLHQRGDFHYLFLQLSTNIRLFHFAMVQEVHTNHQSLLHSHLMFKSQHKNNAAIHWYMLTVLSRMQGIKGNH